MIELSVKSFSNRAFFVVVKNVRTHMSKREAVERSRVCLRLKGNEWKLLLRVAFLRVQGPLYSHFETWKMSTL